ncbi:MAG TPA: hypothetical protein VGU20_19865 [Stellaceae bacterium]|nr:hypothetical protein [Stellaceae bacterium]
MDEQTYRAERDSLVLEIGGSPRPSRRPENCDSVFQFNDTVGTMRKLIPIIIAGVLALTLVATSSGAAMAERGVVALKVSGCDYYLIYTNSGYVLVEGYGGHDPWKGEAVAGAFNSYGMKTVFFGSGAGRIYIEEYWLSADAAVEQLSDKCS